MSRKLETATIGAVLAIAGICPAVFGRASAPSSCQAEFKTDQVHIIVSVQSSIYTYKVSNRGPAAIVEFKVETPAAFAIIPPEWWEKELSEDALRAYTNDPEAAIEPNETAEFALLAIGRGSVLGRAPIKLRFQPDRMHIVAGVWAPVLEPKSYTALVTGLLLFIVLAHTVIIVRRDKRRRKTSTGGA